MAGDAIHTEYSSHFYQYELACCKWKVHLMLRQTLLSRATRASNLNFKQATYTLSPTLPNVCHVHVGSIWLRIHGQTT